MFAVIWYGSPHSPFKSLEQDRESFSQLDNNSANHYGELVALDRSIGTLRASLQQFGLAQNTMLVFCSDNGGLPGIQPETVGGLRGNKGSVFEGGLRVPGIIEWPAMIHPRITHYPACVMDLFPTVADIVGLPKSAWIQPQDGQSLKPLFEQEIARRNLPMGFRYGTKRALIDDQYKLLTDNLNRGTFELYDLRHDDSETHDLSQAKPEIFETMKRQLLAWDQGVTASGEGKDYPEGNVTPADPEPVNWYDTPSYQHYLEQWSKRPEFESYLKRANKKTKVVD